MVDLKDESLCHMPERARILFRQAKIREMLSLIWERRYYSSSSILSRSTVLVAFTFRSLLEVLWYLMVFLFDD